LKNDPTSDLSGTISALEFKKSQNYHFITPAYNSQLGTKLVLLPADVSREKSGARGRRNGIDK